ncbi:B3 DNA binding domain-containing protein, partial [Tanacetum coccineum]
SYALSWKPCQGDSLNLPDHSQMAYLHENLLKGLNVKLAVRIILETVIIDDAIRACEVTITRDDIKTWDKTLKAFEKIIMKVMFLRALISKLKGLLFESNELLEAKRKEQAKAEEEMKIIKEKLNDVRGVIKNLNVEIETLNLKGQKLDTIFHKEAYAPWGTCWNSIEHVAAIPVGGKEGSPDVYVIELGGTIGFSTKNPIEIMSQMAESGKHIHMRGDYLGKTIQVVPHITDAIQDWIERVAAIHEDGNEGSPDAERSQKISLAPLTTFLMSSLVCVWEGLMKAEKALKLSQRKYWYNI